VLLLLVPAAPADEAHYHLHSHMTGRQHDSITTYQQRLTAFAANKAKILSHNKQVAAAAAAATTGATGSVGVGGQDPARKSEGVTASEAVGHTLELNHFADFSRDEFDRVMLPLKWKRDHGFEVQKVSNALSRLFRHWHLFDK